MHRALGLIVVAVLLAVAACGGGDEEDTTVGQAGERPTTTEAPETTTTTTVTTTTLPLEITPVPEIDAEVDTAWDGETVVDPDGVIATGDFNAWLADNAPAGLTAEAAVAIFLGLDPADVDVQMLSGPAGGPEAQLVVVIEGPLADDSLRALRYEFVVERRARDAEEEAAEDVEEAEEGNTGDIDDELASNEGDAATDEQLAIVEGDDTIPWVVSALLTTQCQPNRGHQDFTLGDCV